MFASFDPVAIDVACADAVQRPCRPSANSIAEAQAAHGDCHHDHFKDISPDPDWNSQTEHAEKIGLGQQKNTSL